MISLKSFDLSSAEIQQAWERLNASIQKWGKLEGSHRVHFSPAISHPEMQHQIDSFAKSLGQEQSELAFFVETDSNKKATAVTLVHPEKTDEELRQLWEAHKQEGQNTSSENQASSPSAPTGRKGYVVDSGGSFGATKEDRKK
jgi:acetoin utilization deacetylase AcuC-like enzyme